MKKMLIMSAVLLVLGFVPHVMAQGFVPLAPIPNLTQGGAADSAGLTNFFNNLYKYLIGLAATLAVIQITWAGIEIALNRDNVSKITDDKGKIYNALFGLLLVLSPALVFSIINPSILNLSLNLPALQTTSSQTAPAPTGTAPTYSADYKIYNYLPSATPSAPTNAGFCFIFSKAGSPSIYYGCSGGPDSCNSNYVTDKILSPSNTGYSSCQRY